MDINEENRKFGPGTARMESIQRYPNESYIADAVRYSSISWRAIFAGGLIALLTYTLLMTLGMAFGGANLQGVIQGEDTIQGLGVGAGIWLIVSVLISLFVGSYVSGRVGGLLSTRIGRIQGAVVSALFFGLLLTQLGAAIGALGRGVGSIVGSAGGAAVSSAQSSQVQDIIDDALEGTRLKAPPDTVARGLASRLLRGDTDGATAYFARQTGMSRAEAQTRMQDLKQKVTKAATDAGTAAAKGLKVVGWTLFGAILLGTLSALIGGGAGAQVNLRAPLGPLDRKALRNQKAA
jgi:hypothetical protein